MKILAKFIVPLFIFLSSDYLISQFDNPGSYKVKREFGQFSIMRDGVLLATDVYRPKTNDKILFINKIYIINIVCLKYFLNHNGRLICCFFAIKRSLFIFFYLFR